MWHRNGKLHQVDVWVKKTRMKCTFVHQLDGTARITATISLIKLRRFLCVGLSHRFYVSDDWPAVRVFYSVTLCV